MKTATLQRGIYLEDQPDCLDSGDTQPRHKAPNRRAERER
jgi:hypothetical protein